MELALQIQICQNYIQVCTARTLHRVLGIQTSLFRNVLTPKGLERSLVTRSKCYYIKSANNPVPRLNIGPLPQCHRSKQGGFKSNPQNYIPKTKIKVQKKLYTYPKNSLHVPKRRETLIRKKSPTKNNRHTEKPKSSINLTSIREGSKTQFAFYRRHLAVVHWYMKLLTSNSHIGIVKSMKMELSLSVQYVMDR